MTKMISMIDSRRKVAYGIVVLLLVGGAGKCCADAETERWGDNATPFWVSGNQKGAFVVVPHSDDEGPAFQAYFVRGTDRKVHRAGSYRGQVSAVIVAGARLHVFRESGRHNSYVIGQSARTEKPVPESLQVLAGAAAGDQPYILVRARTAVSLPHQPKTTDESAPQQIRMPQSAAPSALAQASLLQISTNPARARLRPHFATAVPPVQLEVGDCALITRTPRADWYSLTDMPLPVQEWQTFSLAVLNKTVHLFGLLPRTAETGADDLVPAYCSFGFDQQKPIVVTTQPDLRNITNVTACVIGGQITLVMTVRSPTAPVPGETGQRSSAFAHHLCSLTDADQAWSLGAALKQSPDVMLTAGPERLRFTTLGPDIAVFYQVSANEVRMGCYSPHGTITRALSEPSITAEPAPLPLEWLFNPYAAVVLIVAAGVLIFYRRADVLMPATPLPAYVRLAPFWRRILAFLLDLMVPFLLTMIVFAGPLLELGTQSALAAQNDVMRNAQQMVAENPKLFLRTTIFLYSALIAYFTVAEMLMSTTPGKRLLGLVVVNYSGQRLAPRQAIYRNLLRLLELYPQVRLMTLLVMLFSVRRQRIGDLAARTIVVLNTPAPYPSEPQTPNVSSMDAADQTNKKKDEHRLQ